MSVSRVPLQKRSLSSHHLIPPADSPDETNSQLIVVKPEVNCGGSVMSVGRACSTFTYDDGQSTGSMRQNVEDISVKSDLSGADSPSNLFSCNWIDSSRSSAELTTITIKPEPALDGNDDNELRQYEDFAARGLELPSFVGSRNQYLGHGGPVESQNCMNDVCLDNPSLSQQHTGGVINNVDMMALDVSMDGIRQQQMIVDENLTDYGFSPHHSSLMSSQSMPLLPAYTASEVIKGPTAAGYRMAGMFADKSQSFVDPAFSYSGPMAMTYNGGVHCQQADMLAKEPESGYGRGFGYSDHQVMPFQNSDQRNNQSDVYFSSMPRTPTLYAAVGPKQQSQQSGNRTPRTPYTPSTPGRCSRFQFPSITEGAVVGTCQHRYQKSTAYHPYGHQHTATQAPQLTQLGPASPHYLNQRHVANIAHEMDQQQFRHDVAHAQQEIEQRLQQLQHEDKIKQMMMTDIDTTFLPVTGTQCQPSTATVSSAVSPDTSVRNAALSRNSHDGLSPVDEVLQLIMRDVPEISSNAGSIAPIVPPKLKSESIREASVTSYPHSASDSLLSQIAFSDLAEDQTELKKLRRKHKPEPLVIPPDVSNFGSDSGAMQWSCMSSDVSKTQFLSNMSATSASPGMGVSCDTHWVQRPQQMSRDAEPRSAPPFHWSSAVMCKLIFAC